MTYGLRLKIKLAFLRRLYPLVRQRCICCTSKDTEPAHEGSWFCWNCENHFMPNDKMRRGKGGEL